MSDHSIPSVLDGRHRVQAETTGLMLELSQSNVVKLFICDQFVARYGKFLAKCAEFATEYEISSSGDGSRELVVEKIQNYCAVD